MKVTVNDAFEKNTKAYALNLFTAGYGELDTSWNGSVINSPFSRLYFILDGEFHIITDSGTKIPLKCPNIYLIPSGFTYRYACNTHAKHLFFHLNMCTFDKIDVFGELDSVIRLEENYSAIGEELRELTLSNKLANTFRAEQIIRGILSSILKENKILLTKNEYTTEIQKAIEYITKNLSLQLQVSEIANYAHLAPSTLTKKFKQETGMSVGEYIDRQIMFKAERMLTTTNISVLKISELLGFCDQFYFSRKFKEMYGAPPSKHRKKINI